MLTVLTALLIATSADAPPQVSLAEALTRAVDSPRLRALSDIEALHAQAGDTRAWPGLTVEALPGARLSPAGAANPAVQGAVTVPFVLADVGGARRAVESAEVEGARAEAAAARFDVQVAVIHAWFDRRAAEARVARAEEGIGASHAERAAVAAAVAADGANALDVAELDAFIAELKLEALDAEGVRTDAGLRLGRLLGFDVEVGTDGGPTPVVDGVYVRADAVDADGAGRSAAHAHFARAAAATSLAMRETEALAWAPILGVGLAAQVDDPQTGFAYGRLTLTLPSFEGDPVARAALGAQRERALASAAEFERDHATRRTLLAHEQHHTREIFSVLDAGLVPAARARLSLLEQRHALGDIGLVEVLRARRALLAAQLRHERAALDVARADALAHHILSLEQP